MKVFVYFNLHRKCWSIKALEGPQKGLVVAHAKRVNVSNAIFKVSEAGRQRVLREKRKNVHAGIVGQWDGHCDANPPTHWEHSVKVTYNPYKFHSFYEIESGDSISWASDVHLSKGAIAFF